MATFRFELNKRGLRHAALYSSEVGAAIRDVAEGIAGRARGITNDEITVETQRRRDRLGVVVARSNAAGEAEDRALGRSVGGA